MNEEFREEVNKIIATKILIAGDDLKDVFYGSSSFRLWESLPEDFPELKPLNIAFGGSTINDCIDYFDTLLKKCNPRSIYFYAGDNDIGQGATADEVVERFKTLYLRIRAAFPEVPFTFISIKPSPKRMPQIAVIRESNNQIQNIILHDELASYIDVHTPMLTDSGVVKEGLYQEDNLHMNDSGYRIWIEQIKEHLSKALSV